MAKVTHKAESLHSFTEVSRSTDDFHAIYREHYATIWRFLLHLGVRKSDVPGAEVAFPPTNVRDALRLFQSDVALA